MAVDLLSIPAMSDEPERLFSRLGLIITPHRNHIKQEAVQAIICLHSWDKSGLIDLRRSPHCIQATLHGLNTTPMRQIEQVSSTLLPYFLPTIDETLIS
jgi:hypothetical protein